MPQNSLVPVKKVAFGTFEYICLRSLINPLILRRNRLARNYEENKVEHGILYRTIRNLANLVYFLPTKRMRIATPINTVPKEKLSEQLKRERKKGKGKVPMKLPPNLFDNPQT